MLGLAVLLLLPLVAAGPRFPRGSLPLRAHPDRGVSAVLVRAALPPAARRGGFAGAAGGHAVRCAPGGGPLGGRGDGTSRRGGRGVGLRGNPAAGRAAAGRRLPRAPGGAGGDARSCSSPTCTWGPTPRAGTWTRIAEAVRRAEPDLVVLTGDQVDDYARDVEPLGRALGGLRAPLGVIADRRQPRRVRGLGGGARGDGAPRLDGARERGRAPRSEGGARFWVAGTGDPAGYGGPTGPDASVVPDVERTLASVPRGARSRSRWRTTPRSGRRWRSGRRR